MKEGLEKDEYLMVSVGPLDLGISIGIIIVVYFLLLKRNSDSLELKTIAIIILIGAIGLVLRLISLFLVVTPDRDATFWFMNRSTAVLNGHTSLIDFWDCKPVWTYILAAWFYIFGISVGNILLLLIVVDVSTILIMFFVGKDLLGIKQGYLASMFYAFNPFTIIFSSGEGKMDAIPVLCAVAAFWFLNQKKLNLSAISLGTGIMFKYLAGLYFIPFLFFLQKSWNRKDIMKYIAICAITIILIALPFLLIAPVRFIEDTFFFFITKEMGKWMHELHPYNFMPFYAPFIFVWIAWIVVIFLGASINDFRIKDELSVLFFFVMFTVLFNRSVFSQYFTYTIPILGLLFAYDLFKNDTERLSLTWRAITACLIPILLSFEYVNVYGIRELPFPLHTVDWISALDVHIYFGILIATFLLFFDWFLTLRNESRLVPPKLMIMSTLSRFKK
jgi:uncharacterized membrane protein